MKISGFGLIKKTKEQQHKLNKHSAKYLAFTLAEVLITLAIIGIVAALTIPTLINKYQVSSWETGLKKSYSTITNGFHMIASENDGDLRNSGLFDDVDNDTFSERMDKAIRAHFKVAKTCKIGDTTNCPGYYNSPLSGTQTQATFEQHFDYFNADNYFIIYLSDGSIVSMQNGKCVESIYKNETNLKYNCAFIFLDTNGQKAPNTRGKDVFQLGSLDEKGNIYPHTGIEWAKGVYGFANALNGSSYWKNARSQCGIQDAKTTDSADYIQGQNCLARIMENGWQMDYLK